MELLEALTSRVVLADGAMGTMLLSHGAPKGSCLEELCVSKPQVVEQVHREYLAAGAQVIRTHSFGSNAGRLARWGMERRVGELNWLAARIARDAVKGTGAIVAASVGPTGGGADSSRMLEEQLGALLDGGAQCVIFETFTDVEELLTGLEVKQSLHHCPVVTSVVCDAEGKVAGQEISEVWERLRESGADVVAVNCTGTPTETVRALNGVELAGTASFPSGGLPDVAGQYGLSPEGFAEGAAVLIERGVRLVGGCCGTTPAHLAALSARLPEPR